jgi:hypothetical protein
MNPHMTPPSNWEWGETSHESYYARGNAELGGRWCRPPFPSLPLPLNYFLIRALVLGEEKTPPINYPTGGLSRVRRGTPSATGPGPYQPRKRDPAISGRSDVGCLSSRNGSVCGVRMPSGGDSPVIVACLPLCLFDLPFVLECCV